MNCTSAPLVISLLLLASTPVFAATQSAACRGESVVQVLSCRSELRQGGNGVKICQTRHEKGLTADVSGIIARSGRIGFIASYKVKQEFLASESNPTSFVDKKSNGKNFDLTYLGLVAPTATGARYAELNLSGHKSAALICRLTSPSPSASSTP